VILAPSPPLTIGLGAFLVSRLRRAPFIYNVHDIYPDIAVRLGLLKNPRLVGLFRRLEKFVYGAAAAITVLAPVSRDNLLAKGVPPGKVRVIPNFADAGRVRPLARRNGWAERQGLNGQFVVMYAGNLGSSQPVEVLLAAARLLRDDPAVRVVIVGSPARVAALRAAEGGNGGNVLFLPFQPKADVPEMYAAADVNVVLLRREVGAESVPSKTYTIMASGRPVLASVAEANEVAGLVRRAECGLWVPPEDPAALAGAVRQLQADPALRERLGRNGRQAVEAQFNQRGVARAYLELFEQVVKRP
jgi:colanic acid biosynthesis glycosyl transferase WcaI